MSSARTSGEAGSPSVAKADDSPFELSPDSDRATGAAALCLHGLTGTPHEVRPVAEALAARGVRARGIRMAGHGESIEVLARTRRDAWVERAAGALRELRAEHDRVFLVGVSMGGLVSLRLAQVAAVDALVVIGTPLALAPPLPQLVRLLRPVVWARRKRGSDIRDPVARARHPETAAMPLDAVAELIALQREVVPALDRIRAPILVAHGRLDRTARPRDAERLHRSVGSQHRELLMLPRSGHVATVDYDGADLARAAADFLTRPITRDDEPGA